MKKYMILVLMMFVLAGCNFALEKALDVRAKIKRNFINILGYKKESVLHL